MGTTVLPGDSCGDRRYHRIAGWLCELTRGILWRQAGPWLAQRDPGARLRCRVGRGEATYHRRADGGLHEVTFGWKMVASKHRLAEAQRWKTAREIAARGYFGGEITVAHLLAHTCCHEFAHVVQSVNGWYHRGSIHNAQFYRILDRMHAGGAARRVLDALHTRARADGIDLAFTQLGEPAAAVFDIGDRVRFDYRGRPVLGEVTRVNRKTLNVKPLLPSWGETYFRISPHLLAPA